MEYRLLSKGRLRDGIDEIAAMIGLQKLTGHPTQQIRDTLLSGKTIKLKSGNDKAKLQAMHDRFYALGLDVVLESVSVAPESPPQTRGSTQRGPRVWLILLSVLCIALVAAAAYLWFWFKAPLSADAQQAEAALADGQLVAMAHVDVQKLRDLQRIALGDLDPDALPVAGAQRALMQQLLDGPARLGERLQQVFFAVQGEAEGAVRPGGGSLLMTGDFDRAAILATVSEYYRIETLGEGPWSLLTPLVTVEAQAQACPSDPAPKHQSAPLYLQLNPRWALLSDDQVLGEHIAQRMTAADVAAQDLADWRAYRQGKLATLMVMNPGGTGPALGGFAGMMAKQAAEQARSVRGIAASISVDLRHQGLHANLRLISADDTWNRSTADTLRTGMAALRNDSRKVSPTLAELLARIEVADHPDAVAIDLTMTRSMLDDLGQAVREGVGSLFSVNVSEARPGDKQQDQIDPDPIDYAANAALLQLPALTFESYEPKPLFVRGAFGVNLESIRLGDEGLLEMRLAGSIALPKTAQGGHQERSGELRFQVDAVTDAAGNDLLRDERCVKANTVANSNRNHEPASFGQLFGSKASIHKVLRLREGVQVEDIRQVRGTLALSAPMVVRKFSPKLQVGEVIELAGVRFYLSGIGNDSVSYQLSGDQRHLLDVRALNVDGKVLRKGWRIGGDDGRISQHYQGKVYGLDVYVAERFAEHQADFTLSDLFKAPADDGELKPKLVAPPAMAGLSLTDYAQVDLEQRKFERNKWFVAGKNKMPVATASWPGMKLFITQTPSEWDNEPMAHLYYPMLPQLPGVLSALSYQIETPVTEDGVVDHYLQVSYPYGSVSGEWVMKEMANGKPLASTATQLVTGLAKNTPLDRLKGKLLIRLPLQTVSSVLELKDLWRGVTIDGIKVTLTDVNQGMFPGYALKLDGDLSRLVRLQGLAANGEKITPEPVNFQDSGYWTMTLPFGHDMTQVEIITAVRQQVQEYPFDLKARYP